jgi:Fe2+ transport system protein FeoA
MNLTLADIKETSDKEYLVVKTCNNHRLCEIGVIPGAKIYVRNRLGGALVVEIEGSGCFALNEISTECVKLEVR